MANKERVRSRPIVSVSEFKKLPDTERRLAFMAGYKSLRDSTAPRPQFRETLLNSYIAIAGWDDESVKSMRSAAVTPIR